MIFLENNYIYYSITEFFKNKLKTNLSLQKFESKNGVNFNEIIQICYNFE